MILAILISPFNVPVIILHDSRFTNMEDSILPDTNYLKWGKGVRTSSIHTVLHVEQYSHDTDYGVS